jgi:cell division initiation protein
MDVSPKTLREVEFREKMRGYHPEDVDHFLEEVANGLEALQDRLRQAVDRAQRAEAAATNIGGTDDTLSRTLVLAQRTADLAIQEAREQAARIVAGAEQQSVAMLADAEERARRAHDDTLAESRAELARLEGVRQQAQSEIDMLRRWVDEHRGRFVSSMRESLAHLERTGVTSPPPSSRPIEVPAARRSPPTVPVVIPPPVRSAESPSAAPAPTPSPAVEVEAHPTGPETVVWVDPASRPNGAQAGTVEARFAVSRPGIPGAPQADSARPSAGAGDDEVRITGPNAQIDDEGPDDQALNDFFDEERFADDRRFGGRLRRKR